MFDRKINKLAIINSLVFANKILCADLLTKLPDGGHVTSTETRNVVKDMSNVRVPGLSYNDLKSIGQEITISSGTYKFNKKEEKEFFQLIRGKNYKKIIMNIYIVEKVTKPTTTKPATTGSTATGSKATGSKAATEPATRPRMKELADMFKNHGFAAPSATKTTTDKSASKTTSKSTDTTKYNGKFDVNYDGKNYNVKFTFIENGKETDLVRLKKDDKNFDKLLVWYISRKGSIIGLLKRSIFEKDEKGNFGIQFGKGESRYLENELSKDKIEMINSGKDVELKITLTPKTSASTSVPTGVPPFSTAGSTSGAPGTVPIAPQYPPVGQAPVQVTTQPGSGEIPIEPAQGQGTEEIPVQSEPVQGPTQPGTGEIPTQPEQVQQGTDTDIDTGGEVIMEVPYKKGDDTGKGNNKVKGCKSCAHKKK